jgi:hypothetical protein
MLLGLYDLKYELLDPIVVPDHGFVLVQFEGEFKVF